MTSRSKLKVGDVIEVTKGFQDTIPTGSLWVITDLVEPNTPTSSPRYKVKPIDIFYPPGFSYFNEDNKDNDSWTYRVVARAETITARTEE